MENHSTDILINYFKVKFDLAPDSLDKIIELFTEHTYGKKEIIQEDGKKSNYVYFVVEGCLRSYVFNTDGNEITLGFYPENNWTGGVARKKIRHIYIQAIEETKVLRMDSLDFEKLVDNDPKMERFVRVLYQNAYVAIQLRLLNSIAQPVLYNYKHLLNMFPFIEQRVSQKHIASYLGVTPEFFSKMKKGYLSSK